MFFPRYKKQPMVIQVTEATPLCYGHDQMQPSEGEFKLLSVILIQRTSVILEKLKKKRNSSLLLGITRGGVEQNSSSK